MPATVTMLLTGRQSPGTKHQSREGCAGPRKSIGAVKRSSRKARSLASGTVTYTKETENWLDKTISHHKIFKLPNHFVALTQFSLATLKMRRSRWADARQRLVDYPALRRTVPDPAHHLVGVGLRQLAFVEDKLDNTDRTVELLREATSVFRAPSRSGLGLLEGACLKLAECLDKEGTDWSDERGKWVMRRGEVYVQG